MNNIKVSPLKEKSLRQAGQGVREQIWDYVLDNLFYIAIVPFVTLILALIEWDRFFFPQPAHPYAYSTLFMLSTIWAGIKFQRTIKNVDLMKQGRDGEIAVGQILDTLAIKGFVILHDVPALGKNGKRFNLDHVIVSSKGIFVVETKTWSKHANGNDKIEVRNKTLCIAGFIPKKDVLMQTVNESEWLAGMLNKKSGRKIIVKSVLAFPGWFIEPSAQQYARGRGVILVNPKSLSRFIENEEDVFSKEDVSLFSNLISSYVKDFID